MTYKKKLIEVALPLPEINDASAYDKMPGIGPHPKGIHQWWARLPLPTARAVLFASVVDDPSEYPEKFPTEEAQNAERERLFDIIRRMMQKKLHEHPEVYAEARAEMLRHCDGRLPPLFDPFAGGGSIPLEASRLGFQSHAGDLNPVAVLLNKCNLELAPRWTGRPPVNPEDREKIGGTGAWRGTHGLAGDVRYYGRLIGNQARAKIGYLYPKVKLTKEYGGGEANVIAWIWARTVASPNPAARGRYVPLTSTFILSTNGGRSAWIEPMLTDSAVDGWIPEVRLGEIRKEKLANAKFGTRAGKAQDFICLLTKTPIPRPYVQSEGKAGRLGRRLMAIVADGNRGKTFLSPVPDHETIAVLRDESVDEARKTLLAGVLPTRAEITGGVCTAYGLNTWGHLFETRQLVALLTLSDLVKGLADNVRRDGGKAGLSVDEAETYARAVTTFLALAVDRCADFNNSLCRWSASNQKVMNLFARQALPMVWDFAEANVLGQSVGAWSTCSEYVADCIAVMAAGAAKEGLGQQVDAAMETNDISNFLVCTDPPYYDNISYGTLSDFFYVWLRRTLGGIYSDLFRTMLVPKLPELIASPDRFGGSREAAKEHFESGFRKAFTNLHDQMDRRFPLTVYYAFKQDDEEGRRSEEDDGEASVDLTTGWETLLEALISSGFQITATWPVRASQKWRMVSMGTNALASYIVLACRRRLADAPQIDRRSFIIELKRQLPSALRHLQQGNIAPVDFAQAAIGPGMAVYSRYSRILESTGNPTNVRTALSLINQTLTEVLSEQEDDFDAETRWAMSWFEQFGFEEGEFGVAETLSKAKNTSVDGMGRAGILARKGGKVRLLRPSELPEHWDPVVDARLIYWEFTHHLVRDYYYEKLGDEATAELLRKIGPSGEIARDLAYRLFNVCEKRKWSQEAQSYNALVLGWPEIARLARENRRGEPQQEGLF
jgi:putative DNA methylase